MTELRVIEGGRGRTIGDADPAERVRRVEQDVTRIVCLIAPAVATFCKTKAELARMVAAAEFKDAAATHAAFKEGAEAARALSELLRSAESKLFAAITAAVREEMQKPPTR